MADWKKLAGTEVAFKSDSNTFFEKDVNVPTYNNAGEQVMKYNPYGLTTYIEYDADRTTTTYTYIRFRGTHEGGNTYADDSCLVFYNPNNSPSSIPRKLYTIKPRKGNWTTADSHEIKITKGALESKFSIQDYWICNNGAGSTADVWNQDITNAYNYFNETRAKWVQKGLGGKSFSIQADKSVATNVTGGSLSIVDNKNNSVTFKATKGKNGDNNKVTRMTLYYATSMTNSVWNYEKTTFISASREKDVTFTPANTNDTLQVAAYLVTEGEHNTVTSSVVRKGINQYIAPSAPPKPKLIYTRSRLTIKEEWKFSWEPGAEARNTPSALKGYRITLYKNGSVVKGLGVLAAAPNKLQLTSSTNIHLDRVGNIYEAVIDPVAFGFNPGDIVAISVSAYTSDDSGTKYFSGTKTSDNSTVQNAGIVHVNIGNGDWKEGQVYVNIGDGKWKEAETVNVNIGTNTWKESQ